MNDRTFSKKLHRSIIAYSVLGILTVSIIIALVSIVPLYGHLKREEEINLVSILRAKTMAVEECVSKARAITSQLTARTGLREKLETYNNGRIGLDELKAFTEERLRETLSQAEDIAAISRLDFRQRLVVQVGLPIPREIWVIPDKGSVEVILHGPIHLDGELYLVMGAPILGKDQVRTGTDIVLLRLPNLRRIIEDHTGLGESGETVLGIEHNGRVRPFFSLRRDKIDLEKGFSKETALGSVLTRAIYGESGVAIMEDGCLESEDIVIAFGPVQGTQWGIAVKMDKTEAYANVYRQVIIVGGVMVFLVLAGTLGMMLLLRPITGKIVIHSDELQREIQDKTESLQIELSERKRAEEELRAAKTLWESTFASLDEAVFVLDPVTRNIVTCNPAAGRIFGYAHKDLIGANIKALHLDDQMYENFGERMCAALNAGRTYRTEYRMQGTRSEPIYTDHTVTEIVDETGMRTGVVSVVRDITRRKLAELALVQSEREKELILGSVSDVILYLDKDLRIIWANDAARQTVAPADGAAGEIVGKQCHILLQEKDEPCGNCPILKAYETGRVEEGEVMGKTERIWFSRGYPVRDESGAVTGVVLFARDVTDHKRKERDLMRLSTAIAHTVESVVITDREGVVQYVNPAFEQLTGYSRDETLGRPVGDLKEGEHEEAFFDYVYRKVCYSGVWKGRFTRKRKDGTLFTSEVTVSPVRGPQGEIDHYVAVGRDVTHEVGLQKRLLRAERMEAIGTLAAGIAHDFNNILMPIMANAGMVLRSLSNGDPNRRRLERVVKASERARDLVRQVLHFSRTSDHDRKPLRMSTLVKETLKLIRSSIPSSIEVRSEIRSASDLIMADPTQMHQVLMNLFTNATHALRETGGMLEVVLEDARLGDRFVRENPGAKPGEYLCLGVRDTGCGMDHDILERIFEPYFTTRKPGEGTGLGLAIVHGVVRRHEGVITVESEPGEGSLFRAFFPIAGISEAQTESEAIEVHAAGRRRVLVVDDDEEIIDTLHDMLDEWGYLVISRRSGAEALEVFQSRPDSFDLVITDQIMPEMTGLELAERVLSLKPSVAVILCTGFSDKITPETMRKLGIRKLLKKPIDDRTMADAIREALEAD